MGSHWGATFFILGGGSPWPPVEPPLSYRPIVYILYRPTYIFCVIIGPCPVPPPSPRYKIVPRPMKLGLPLGERGGSRSGVYPATP